MLHLKNVFNNAIKKLVINKRDLDSLANVLKYNYLFSFSLMNFLSLDHFLFLAATCLGGVLPSSS